MPYVIALTGGIGSGKSSVAAMFAELGATVIDTDVIAHELTAPGAKGSAEISRKFGPLYLKNGALDRERMRALIFSDPAAKKKLEGILHPMIRAEVAQAVLEAPTPYAIIVVPLLVETGAYADIAQRTLVVDCDEAQQLARISSRGLGNSMERAIMASQATRAERLKRADDIISNNSSLAALRPRVIELHHQYLNVAQKMDR
jgi:dephospho-CoA kinase